MGRAFVCIYLLIGIALLGVIIGMGINFYSRGGVVVKKVYTHVSNQTEEQRIVAPNGNGS